MSDASQSEESLYDRVGGADGIEKMVAAFYAKVLADPELKTFFHDVDIDKLHRMQLEFFSSALGGPITYTGRPLAHVHHGMGITPAHMARWTRHLFETLEDFQFSATERDEIISRVDIVAAEILGGGGLDG